MRLLYLQQVVVWMDQHSHILSVQAAHLVGDHKTLLGAQPTHSNWQKKKRSEIDNIKKRGWKNNVIS